MKNLTRNGRICYLLIGLLLILEIGGLFYNSGIVFGMNERADKLKVYAIASKDDATILPGDICDRNGLVLAETNYENVLDGSRIAKTDLKTKYTNVEAYATLLGYTGSRRLSPSATSIENIVGERSGYRFMAFMDNDVWTEQGNGLYAISKADDTKGQTVTMTIDNDIQMKVYEALSKQMSPNDAQGSAVVLNAKTGEILAMVSFPTYDFNDLSSALAQMEEDEKNTNLEPGYTLSYKNAKEPGSIFKIVTEVAMIDNGMEDFLVEDAPFTLDGWSCNNAYTSKGNTIDYTYALKHSSNVFFAKGALALSREKFNETAQKFMLTENEFTDENGDGKDDEGTYLKLDFGWVPYNWDLDAEDEASEDILLAQTAFGQGKTQLTTIHAAMITQAIANDGVMLKPYLVHSLTDIHGKVKYKGETEVLSNATSKSTADKVTKAMVSTVKYNCEKYQDLEEVGKIFDTYRVAGKTGTAEVGDKTLNNAWFVSFAPAENPEYVVVVNQCNTEKSGYKMMTTAGEIYEYLFENE